MRSSMMMKRNKKDITRVRVSKACDRCGAHRSKCSGDRPCARCIELNVACLYTRVSKKRGRTAAGATPSKIATADSFSSDSNSQEETSPNSVPVHNDATTPSQYHESGSMARGFVPEGEPMNEITDQPRPGLAPRGPSRDAMSGSFSYHYADSTSSGVPMYARDARRSNVFSMSPTADFSHLAASNFDSNSGDAARKWIGHRANTIQDLRYPVLQPIVGFIIPSVLPAALACDLLELYFSSSTSAFQHPVCPYITAYMFRRNSFLTPLNHRSCSPALLASMLWIAAQTSDDPFFSQSLPARGRVCQKLLELTIDLLKPLVHQPNSSDDPMNTVVNGVAMGGFGINVNIPLPGGRHGELSTHGAREPSAEVDDIATYIHLATVISASEYKAASIRWWSVVWSLARELRFEQELPVYSNDGLSGGGSDDTQNFSKPITEETREERRRVWWLVYTVDRHLSLCYNQPVTLQDVECASLLRPQSELHWQDGAEYHGPSTSDQPWPRGPTLQCIDHSIFGFFTPITVILGEIIDLQKARIHPRLGTEVMTSAYFEPRVDQIKQHLNEFSYSLSQFRAHRLPTEVLTGNSPREISGGLSEFHIQTIIVSAYATHLVHVMHFLLAGRWDPVQMLDDEEGWISSASFAEASNHAIEAAEALAPILEYDPDLSFMPWFFGIYLLQGSFLLLLYADKLGTHADGRVVGACETAVRAIEACIVTLNTEYQRTFRKVMRSALAQVKGRVPNDFNVQQEQKMRRREALMLFRWTGTGRGLAI